MLKEHGLVPSLMATHLKKTLDLDRGDFVSVPALDTHFHCTLKNI